MKLLKESHKLLGEYLLGCRSLPGRICERAFLWGCVEPDYNYLTYLKGSLRIQPLRGHNFQNSRRCILRMAGELQWSGCRDAWDFYRLGKLIHYISDAFTYPHNRRYGRSLKGHVRYEEALHSFFLNGLPEPAGPGQEGADRPVGEYILIAHQKYDEASADPSTDLWYILTITAAVFRRIVSEKAPVRLWNICEDGLCEELAYAGHPGGRTAG